MTHSPQLLFLAYYFPPVQAIASVRSWNIVKYLSRLGWRITVVTPDPSLWRRVEPGNGKTPDALEGVRCLFTGHSWRCLNPGYLRCRNEGLSWFVGGLCRKAAAWRDVEREAGWASAVTNVCRNVTPGDVDVILATGGPFITFELAARLGKQLDRPYVVDYRDPWTMNPHIAKTPRATSVRREASLVKASAAATTISASVGSSIDGRFKIGDRLHVVPNGFDPEELAAVEPHQFGHFAIVYTGQFSPPKRTIDPVMAALQQLKDSPGWYFHYYGGQSEHVGAAAARYGVSDRVKCHGNVSRREAMAAVRGAGVSVVITSVLETSSIEDKGIVTGKVFEALGLGTPILCVAPAGSDIENVIETASVARRYSGSEVPGIAGFLRDTMARKCNCNHTSATTYAWPNIARKMDAVLRAAMQSTPEPRE